MNFNKHQKQSFKPKDQENGWKVKGGIHSHKDLKEIARNWKDYEVSSSNFLYNWENEK